MSISTMTGFMPYFTVLLPDYRRLLLILIASTCWPNNFLTPLLSAADHQQPIGYAPLVTTNVQPLSSDLSTKLEVPTHPIVIGAPLVIHYTIHNGGLSLFNWIAGGDNSRLRPSRIWLEAQNDQGAFARDRLITNWELGESGAVSLVSVDPLGSSSISINPLDYVQLDRPGRWTLRLFHDLGMGPKPLDRDPRWASATIELIAPTPEQAIRVLQLHIAALQKPSPSKEQRLSAQADFSAMCLPVYLPILMQHAQRGSLLAINGLEQIPDPVAVDYLLALLEQEPLPLLPEEKDLVQGTQPLANILSALNLRFAPVNSETAKASSGDSRLIATMDANRAQRIMNAAFIFVAHEDKRVRDAAAILLSHGSADNQAFLPQIEDAINLNVKSDRFNLLLSAHARINKSLPEPGTGAATGAVWMYYLIQHADYRPDQWQLHLPRWFKHESPRLRTLALTLIPNQLSTQWSSAIMTSLQSSDKDEKMAAISAAGRCRDPAFITPLRQLLIDNKISSHVVASLSTMVDRYTLCQAWLELLAKANSEDEAQHALSWFYRSVSISGSGSGIDHAFFASWKPAELAQQLTVLIRPHQQAINAKKDDTFIAQWPINIMPKKWAILLSNGQIWPPVAGKSPK